MLAGTAIFGQKANFKGGLEGGIVGTQVDGENLSGFNKAGFRFGGFIEKPLNDKWSGQFSMVYFPKGSRDSINYAIRLHYIEMPLTIRYYHQSGVFGEAGLSLGYLFSQKEQGIIDFGYHQTNEAGFNDFELGSHLGVGYKLFPNTYVHAQWGYSLLPIWGDGEYIRNVQYNSLMEFFGLYGLYNNTLMLSLQVYLGTRK